MAEATASGTRFRAIEKLKAASDGPAQLDLLRAVKNDMIGHETRKAQYVRSGLLPALTHILSAREDSRRISSGSLNIRREESISIEAANVVCLVAHEGPAFVQPILASNLHSTLRQRLSSGSSPHEKLAVLKCLNAIADNLPPSAPELWVQDTRLGDDLYATGRVDFFVMGITNARNTVVSQQVCDSTIALMCKTCKNEWQKQVLTDAGILHALSERLASIVVAEGLVMPNLGTLENMVSSIHQLPEPAPKYARLSPVLEILALLLEDSIERAELFLADPVLALVFPVPHDDFSPSDMRQAPWGSTYFSGAAVPKSRSRNAFDSLIPVLPTMQDANASHLNFPPLGSGGLVPRRRPSFQPSITQNNSVMLREVPDEKEERSVVPWLLFIARESRQTKRLLAAKLLVILYSLKLIRKSRSQTFSGLLVPILASALDSEEQEPDESGWPSEAYLYNGMHYSTVAPSVLAMLIMDDPVLQNVAVDAKVIVKLSNGLKRTFEEPLARKASPWQPNKESCSEPFSISLDSILGSGGPSRTMRRDMAYREGILQALAAIAPFNDDYRKQICDQGVLTQIMLALEPFHLLDDKSPDSSTGSVGNSASTILAACGAVRALTRSVTALRTKLVDAEVAKSIIKLMNNSDPEVRIAATKVLANLAMYLSPMKESVGESAVVKKLCEQAHSANARLRLESIWALKQLVVNASKKLKQEIINELGCSWIKLLIRTDPYDIPPGEVIGLVDREYPPRSNLPTNGGRPEDVVMNEDSDDDHATHDAHTDGGGTSTQQAWEQDDDFSKRVPEDDLAIQEQLLDLIRNLFCGDNASDIVDYLLSEIGEDDFFKILLTRLRPRSLLGPTRKDNQISAAPAGIVTKVLYIVVHIAACSHKWRSTVAKEQVLLKQVLSFSTHGDRTIRAQCCWVAINLMYVDEVSDRQSCKQRAIELQKIGFIPHLRKLENDSDLDVRERAKTAIHLMMTLISS